MITVIHGENIKDSRNFYFTEKTRTESQTTLDGANVNVTDLAQSLSGNDLFNNSQAVFIEDLFSKKKKSKERDILISFLEKNSSLLPVTLWESKTLTASELKSLGKIVEKKFDFPKEIFSFLDSITAENEKRAISLFHKTIDVEETEFVFFMMVRHFRILLSLGGKGENQIDEVKRLAPWQRQRLEKQKSLLGKERLLDFYNKLFAIEKDLKTGKLAVSLENTIDFLLLSI